MQNDFCDPDGAFPSAMAADVSMARRIVPGLADFLSAARAAGVLVAHTQHIASAGFRSDSAVRIRRELGLADGGRGWPAGFQYTVAGTWGAEFIPELTPNARDLVVPKYRTSAFVGTSLDLLLRANEIETVIVTGCVTNGCVLATTVHAGALDYSVHVIPDYVAAWDRGLHEAALSLMPTAERRAVDAAWNVDG
ncbi:cysteine hydrolase [Dactylosporangium roseum]